MNNEEYLASLIQTSQDLTRQFAEVQARLDAALHPLEGRFLAFEEIVNPDAPQAPAFDQTIPAANACA